MVLEEFSQFKFLNHLDRLEKLAVGKDILPVMVEIDLVNYCNHRCIWCSDFFHSPIRLEKKFVFKLLGDLKDGGVKSVLFKGGGEPLLHPDFSEIIGYANKIDLASAVITNFSLVDREKVESIVKNCKGIRISLDAVTSSQYEEVHRPKTQKLGLNTVVNNIKYLVNLRKTMNSKLLIGLNFCFDHKTYKSATEAVKLAISLGVNYVGLRKILYQERFYKNSEIPPGADERINRFFEKAEKIGQNKNFPVLIDSFHGAKITRNPDYLKCLAAPLSAVVCANKHVYPCCSLRYVGRYDFGEIKSSFWDIWRSDRRKQIMQLTREMKCLKYCGFRLDYYNKLLAYWKKESKPHGEFI